MFTQTQLKMVFFFYTYTLKFKVLLIKLKQKMETLNKEQQTAKAMGILNTLMGVIAFLPTVLCLIFANDSFYDRQNNPDDFWATTTEESLLFIRSSILLLLFYGYTFFSPRIHRHREYNKSVSQFYWCLIALVNLLTLVLFWTQGGVRAFFEMGFFSLIFWLPLPPLVLSLKGLFENMNPIETTETI